MALPEFEDLPFYDRPDLTPYLVHLTKNSKKEDGFSAFENLVNILEEGKIRGSKSSKGFIKRPRRASCFMDVPFSALKYVLNPRDRDPENPRYEPYGIVVTKKYAHRMGCRPVLYLADDETKNSAFLPTISGASCASRSRTRGGSAGSMSESGGAGAASCCRSGLWRS